eukprot:COSAG06_NODE_51707_length_310_cov_0.976303_1_plen_44_part_01
MWFVFFVAFITTVGFYFVMYVAAGLEVDEDNVGTAALQLKRWVA